MNQPAWVSTTKGESETPSLKNERILLQRLRELCAWRASEEEDIEAERVTDTAGINDALRQSLTQNKDDYESRRAALDEDYKKIKGELEARYANLLRTTQEESEKVRKDISVRASTGERKAKKSWNNEVWLIESDFEANEPVPGIEFRKLQKHIKEERAKIANLDEQSSLLIQQFKQSALLKRDLLDEEEDKVTEEGRSGSTPTENGEAGDEPPSTGSEGDVSSAIDSQAVPHLPAGVSLDDAITQEETILNTSITDASEALERLSRLRIARFFRGPQMGFLGLMLVAGAIAGISKTQHWQMNGIVISAGVLSIILVIIGYWFLYQTARKSVDAVYKPMREQLHAARKSAQLITEYGGRRKLREEAENRRNRDEELMKAKSKFVPMIQGIREERKQAAKAHNETYPRRLAELKRESEENIQIEEERYRSDSTENDAKRKARDEEAKALHDRKTAKIAERYKIRRDALVRGWRSGMEWIYQQAQSFREVDMRYFPRWDDAIWESRDVLDHFLPVVRFGSFTVDRKIIPGGISTDPLLRLDYPEQFGLPAWLTFPEPCSVFIETDGQGRDAGLQALRNMILRLLVSIPPGKARFTFFDPVGLGQNFAAFMHLADHAEALVSERIWTESRHIDQRLLDLTEHMEGVIQKYLRNEYETIAEYNERAGEIAEPYRFLVMADCPVNLSDVAAKRLLSIINSGVRCGVYTLILYDARQSTPSGISKEDLRQHAIHLCCDDHGFHWEDEDFKPCALTVDDPPDDDLTTQLLHKIGEAAKDATRVQVPFAKISPAEDHLWSRSSAEDLIIELGRSGATKLQTLNLGHGTAQHVLIAGKTGSGKSTLLHVLITNTAMWYGPDQVEIYLVDFKKGVEFKTYATHQIPHIRAVAIESDREFGVSVLHRVDAEMKRRGDLFRKAGANDVSSFRLAEPDTPMPRTLLIIDEFQEFFTEDDKLAQDASLLLDRLVRQGRAFGIHIILGSQTLGGAYGLARSTIGQMAIRIALQCSEADSFLIMNEDNSAARLLARPGEAIYNDASGVIGANSPFQIVWLPENERETALHLIREKGADLNESERTPPIVFEGNAPADIQKNRLLREMINGETNQPEEEMKTLRVWFGEPIAIKDPTSVVFRRRGGANVLICGQNEEGALAITISSLVSAAAFGVRTKQSANPNEKGVRLFVLDGTPGDMPNADYLRFITETLPGEITCGGWNEATAMIEKVGAILDERQHGHIMDGPAVLLFINGLHRFRMLRKSEDDYGFSSLSDDDDDDTPESVDKIFSSILRDGPTHGIHAMVWCDSVTTLERMLDRNALREFETRVLFQMGATDSSTLIDTTAASQLGLKRSLIFSEEMGRLEKFRPYALPDRRWIEEIGKELQD